MVVERRSTMNMDKVHIHPPRMPYHHCPRCRSVHAWHLRRDARRCVRCRTEWMPRRFPVAGSRLTAAGWRGVLAAFLRYRTVRSVRWHTHHSRGRLLAMLTQTRTAMAHDVPARFEGTVEIDETYVGGQWRNQPAWVRRRGTKRGHGTSKQAVVGLLHRESGCVVATLVPDLTRASLLAVVRSQVAAGSLIYTDGYCVYLPLRRWYRHQTVDHVHGEYVRGDVHTNGIESFWGYLKRRLKTTGGIRRSRLDRYVAEEAWRFNHRTIPERDQVTRLLTLLRRECGG